MKICGVDEFLNVFFLQHVVTNSLTQKVVCISFCDFMSNKFLGITKFRLISITSSCVFHLAIMLI